MYYPENLEGEARTRMVSAIVVTALFSIFGGFIAIPAIIRSFRAMQLAKAGDLENAYELYDSAKKYITWGIVVGIILMIAYVVLEICLISATDSYSYYDSYYYYY